MVLYLTIFHLPPSTPASNLPSVCTRGCRVRARRALRPRPRLPKTGKFAAAPLPQALEHGAHLRQLGLQEHAVLSIGAVVQLLVDQALHLGGLGRGVLAEGLRDKLDVQRGLHERRERIALALLEGLEEFPRRLLEEVREHLVGEHGCRGGYLRVD
jgi:hypothetical protein